MNRSALTLMLLVSILGCERSHSPYPETPYLGSEEWVLLATYDDQISYYDLGSVRRAGDKVVFNQRIIFDPYGMYLKVTERNAARQQGGLPLILQVSTSVALNCKERTVELFASRYVLEDDTEIAADAYNLQERFLRPNSPGETVYRTLCMTEA